MRLLALCVAMAHKLYHEGANYPRDPRSAAGFEIRADGPYMVTGRRLGQDRLFVADVWEIDPLEADAVRKTPVVWTQRTENGVTYIDQT